MRADQVAAIGIRIAELRKIHGRTQQALAVRAGVSVSLLRKVERGERAATHSVVAAVARALSVNVTDITGQPYAPAPPPVTATTHCGRPLRSGTTR